MSLLETLCLLVNKFSEVEKKKKDYNINVPDELKDKNMAAAC